MTYGTDEACAMPGPFQGRYVRAGDGRVASTTFWRELGEEARVAVGLVISCVECLLGEAVATSVTYEAFRVPGLFHGGDAGLENN